MPKEFTSGGDPRRSLELLWRRQEPGRRGPKQRLSPEALVDAAVALADAEGLEALSMRRVAQALGVSPMSLYTYVPSKAELIDLMFDRVLAEAADPDDTVVGWRAKLAFIARQRWALELKHPWLLDLAMQRPPLGPNVLRKAEVAMRVFEGVDLEPREIAMAAQALQNYVVGALHAARDAREAEARSGISLEAWFAAVAEELAERVDKDAFPLMARMSEAGKLQALDHDELQARFEFGLQRMLDGLESYIRGRT